MDVTVDQIGLYLEHQGATDYEIDEFLEHFGVKGMKWGVRRAQRLNDQAASGVDKFGNRNNKSTQRRIDNVRKIASGKASAMETLRGVAFNVAPEYIVKAGFSIKGGAQEQLDAAQKVQTKIVGGKKKATDVLLRMGGNDIRTLDYSYTDNGS